MNRREFIKTVAENDNLRATTQAETAEFVHEFFAHMERILLDGHDIRLGDIGKLELQKKEERIAVNNFTGKKIKVSPRVKVKFFTFPSMAKKLNKLLINKQP